MALGYMVMTIRTYMPIPIQDLTRYWVNASNGLHKRPWVSPPIIEVPGVGPFDVRSLFLTTASNIAYNFVSYKDFWQIMYRDNYLMVVHENGRSDVIIAAHATFIHPLAPVLDNIIKLFPDKP